MPKSLRTLTLIAFATLPACWGQGLPDQMNFLNSNTNGIHIYGVSAFYGYSLRPALANVALPRSRMNYGVSTTVGWYRLRGKTNFFVRYSPNYSGDPRNSEFNRFNQSASLGISRSFGTKWSLSLSASGQDTSIYQYIFDTAGLGSIAMSQASVSDLAAAFSIGSYADPQSALTLGGSPSLVSPSRALLLGGSLLTYGTTASVAYQPSSRWSISLGSFGAGGARRTDKGQADSGATNYVIPRSIGGNAGVSVSYSLSPRTTLALGADQSYVSSRYQKASNTSTTASFGRKMGERWFLRMSGGVSFVEGVQQSVGSLPSHRAVASGSIGYRTYAHTFIGSYSRSGFDVSTATIGQNTNTSAAWSWARPGSSWGLSAFYNRYQSASVGLDVTGWQAVTSFSKRLRDTLSLSVSYSYVNSTGALFNLGNTSLHIQSVRLTLGWVPGFRRARPVLQGPDPDPDR